MGRLTSEGRIILIHLLRGRLLAVNFQINGGVSMALNYQSALVYILYARRRMTAGTQTMADSGPSSTVATAHYPTSAPQLDPATATRAAPMRPIQAAASPANVIPPRPSFPKQSPPNSK